MVMIQRAAAGQHLCTVGILGYTVVGVDAGGGILGAPVDMVCVAFMIAAIVVFTVVFETSTEKLEHALEEQPAYYQMLFKAYKELMM